VTDAPQRLAMAGVVLTRDSADRRFVLEVEELSLARGEMVALTGASGSGKSTLLEIAGLAARPDRAARLEIAGRDGPVDATALHARGDRAALAALRARIGFVLQSGALLPFLTVAENVALCQRLAGRADPEGAAGLIEALGLAPVAQAWPSALSVGQRQRAAIARAAAHDPAVILADEPTAALDPPTKLRVADLLRRLADETGAAVLVATHERELFDSRADRCVEIIARRVEGGGVETVRAELRGAA
jgi:putative ABC transport system ATP-binding protein